MKIPNLKVYRPNVMVDGVVHGIRAAVCDLQPGEDEVQTGLSFTPSKMLKLASEGIPVSSQTAGAQFDDGYRTLDFEPLPEYQRGIEFAELWERQQTARKKFHKALHDQSKSQTQNAESKSQTQNAK